MVWCKSCIWSVRRGVACFGNIYLGKVVRVLPGAVGLYRHWAGALFFCMWLTSGSPTTTLQTRRSKPEGLAQPIEHQILKGNRLVQVIKEPLGKQRGRLSTQISLGATPGLLCRKTITSVCHKNPHRAAWMLCASAKRWSVLRVGFILRTNGEDASDSELTDDIAYLRKSWARIRASSTLRPAPATAASRLESVAARAARFGQ